MLSGVRLFQGQLRQQDEQADTSRRDFVRCVSRLLRRSEGEEEASAYFGRNDCVVAGALVEVTIL
jgi:hypothetical protein